MASKEEAATASSNDQTTRESGSLKCKVVEWVDELDALSIDFEHRIGYTQLGMKTAVGALVALWVLPKQG